MNFLELYQSLEESAAGGIRPFELSMLSEKDTPLEFNDISNQLSDYLNVTLQGIDGEFDSGDELTVRSMNESVKAGVVAFALSSDSKTAREAWEARRAPARVDEGVTMMSTSILADGAGGIIPTLSMEEYTQMSFEESAIHGMATYNAVLNMLASRQSKAAEALFPTKVITNNDTAIRLRFEQYHLATEFEHDPSGKPIRVQRTPIARGLVDHNILRRPTIELIPYANPDGKSDKYFVPEALVPTKTADHSSGASIETRPLLFGVECNLLGLNSHPGMMHNKVAGYTDQIAPGAKVVAVYLRLVDETTTPATNYVVKYSTRSMPNSGFIRSQQGEHRETNIQFHIDSMFLSHDTLDIDNSPIPPLAALSGSNAVIALGTSITGRLWLDKGNCDLHATKVRAGAVSKEESGILDSDNPVAKALTDAVMALKPEVIGYDVSAKFTDSNWRSRAPIVDVTPIQEYYVIQPGEPLRVISPERDVENGGKLRALGQAQFVSNTINALTTVINYHDELKSYKRSIEQGHKPQAMLGFARHAIDPYVEDVTIDLTNKVRNMETSVRHKSVTSIIVHKLRTVLWKAVVESFYQSTLNLMTGGTETKPRALLVVDPVIARHLNVLDGETDVSRLLGDNFECVVQVTEDSRWRGKIFATMTRGRPAHEDILSYGVHAYSPELTQTVPISRDGIHYRQTTMVPRNLHLNVLPFSIFFEVVGIEEELNNDSVAP